MSPLPQLLDLMAASKRAGVDFDVAWRTARKQAMPGVRDPTERRGWPEILDATEIVWRRAYQGVRAGREGVLTSLGD